MYEIRAVPPFWCIYATSADEFIVRLRSKDNAELVKMILNYDHVFKKPYFNLKNHTPKSKISYEKLVNNNF